MWKPVIAATAALALVGSTLVYAQQQSPGHRHFNPDRFARIANARIAAIKAGLELTPDQAAKWGPYQQSLEDLIQYRVQRMQARQAHQQQAGQAGTTDQAGQTGQASNPPAHRGGGDPFARLSLRADAMTASSPMLKKVADAGEPLYQSLSDAQKARFRVMTRLLLPQLHLIGQPGGQGGREQHRHG
ncbi:MAG TPA: Spy/CpxP family protein refolding chaperone [Acetobacteraceae bacterium]|nr:Spy/CpxP family protein refolding chaperone [Acetobacteraceae bacterium]